MSEKAPRRPMRPVTDETRQQVRELHAQGLGRNEIARRLERSPRTVSELCEEMGLDFDRTATAVATEARKVDAKARRARIIEGLYDIVEDDLRHLRDADDYELTEVSMGKVIRYYVDRLPAQDRKALIGGISTATGAAARLEALDADTGTDAARSMLGALADGIRRITANGEGDDTGEG